MKTPTLISLLMLAVMLSCQNPSNAEQVDSARAAIATQSGAFMDAMERGDAAAAAQVFTADARLSVPGIDGALAGRAAIEKFWQTAIGGGVKGLRLDPTGLEGEGNLRVETGTYTAFGAEHAELGRGQYLLVWKKEAGAWKIHRDYGHGDRPRSSQNASSESTSSESAAGPDRVGLPDHYATQLRLLGDAHFDESTGITTVFGNALAASASGSPQIRYPNGAVIVMEFAQPKKDGEGQLLRDGRGQPVKAEIAHIDVMRRGAGFGAGYGDSRAGEWEFASYQPDGTLLTSPAKAAQCAACHHNAGADKDFVFRLRPWASAP